MLKLKRAKERDKEIRNKRLILTEHLVSFSGVLKSTWGINRLPFVPRSRWVTAADNYPAQRLEKLIANNNTHTKQSAMKK